MGSPSLPPRPFPLPFPSFLFPSFSGTGPDRTSAAPERAAAVGGRGGLPRRRAVVPLFAAKLSGRRGASTWGLKLWGSLPVGPEPFGAWPPEPSPRGDRRRRRPTAPVGFFRFPSHALTLRRRRPPWGAAPPWVRPDLNRRPPGYRPGALPLSYEPRGPGCDWIQTNVGLPHRVYSPTPLFTRPRTRSPPLPEGRVELPTYRFSADHSTD